jgi:cytochrome c553
VKTIAHLIAAFVVLVLDRITGASRTTPVPHGAAVRVIARYPWRIAGALALVLGIAGAVIMASGIVSIKASSGHWRITAWFLDTAKLQSVRTHSLGITPPPLDDEMLVVRGASEYEIACATCHGSPAARPSAAMSAMTPSPPDLRGERLTRWKPAQLFSIVKHGIKFTGMPAWPEANRDDEVWAMVAFLLRMPRMGDAEYRRLAGHDRSEDVTPQGTLTDLDPPLIVRSVCSRCHGPDGTGRDGAFPSLAQQRSAYIEASLRAFAAGSRFSATMRDVALRLNDRDIQEVALYYEQLPRRTASRTSDTAAFSRGAAIATGGLPERGVPACRECHGPSTSAKNPAYPQLSGQHARYLAQQLELLAQRRRGGSSRVNLMHAVVDRLERGDFGKVALYYAGN